MNDVEILLERTAAAMESGNYSRGEAALGELMSLAAGKSGFPAADLRRILIRLQQTLDTARNSRLRLRRELSVLHVGESYIGPQEPSAHTFSLCG